MLKGEPMEKTNLAEQRILAGTEGREIMTFGRRGGQLRRTEGCHEVTQGEKIEGPKTQLEHKVFAAIKEKRKYFYKYISSKKRAK